MKKLLTLAAITLATFPAFADELDTNREKVKQIFISDEEPKVKDALWTSDNVFKVSVKDDGTNRDGYAQYVCLVLSDNGFTGKGVLVRVVDHNKLLKGEWVNLGTAKCP